VTGEPLEVREALAAADRLGAGLMRVDDERIIAEANVTVARLLGFPGRSLVGRTLMEAFLDHRVEELVAGAGEVDAGPIEVMTIAQPRALLEVSAWREEDGAAWVSAQDVTEIQRLRRIRAEFIDNLAHELRTPLASIRLLSEAMALELVRVDVSSRARELAFKIDVESARLAQMVTELLDLAAIEQGESPLRRDAMDLVDVISTVIDRLQPQATGSDVQLSAVLPHTASDLTRFAGDQESISRMLQNLVDNAIKFSPAGSEVRVRLRSEDSELIVEVSDQGPGIPEADRDRVFERFYKVDRARGGPGGTGLGLSIARHIAERHGGRIWVESREGAGSTFTVALPRSRPDDQAG
jgi:two-component system phosphate regulon sensor histidine kinase PhoR